MHVTDLDSLRGSSDKIGTIQRRLAWPLRKDDTDLEAPGWGEPRFLHCAVLLLTSYAHRLRYGRSCVVRFISSMPYQSNGDTMLSSLQHVSLLMN